MYILRNCRFIPELTEGFKEEYGDILISEEKIEEIKSRGYDFGKIREYDLNGMMLMPGMYDLHTHIQYTGYGDMHDGGRDEYSIVLDTVRHAQASLNAGFTTLRDSGGIPVLNARVKEYFDDGRIVGPDLTVCGRLMSPTELGNKANLWADRTVHEVDTAETIRKGVREEVRDGADYIKYVAGGSISMKGSDPLAPISTFEEVKTLVDEAAFKGRYVGAHCHNTASILLCLKAGVRTIEHASMLDEECIEILKKGNAFVIPTLTEASKHFYGNDRPAYASYFSRSAADEIRRSSFESYKMGHKAGLVMGFGTDMGMPNQFHGENAKELIYRKEYGEGKEIDILKEATINSAMILGEDKRKGTVKKGKTADLIAVKGNPLTDISCMCDQVRVVIKAGKIVKNTEE